MISIRGKSYNLGIPIICRLTCSSLECTNKKEDFLYTHNASEINNNSYAGFILNSKDNVHLQTLAPVFQYCSDEIHFNEGDILFIEPRGKITKLYDPLSFTNSIFLTERCNCHCIMCPQPPKAHDEFDWVEFAIQSIKLMNPCTECIGITGGEPTLEWSGLLKVIETCSTYLPSTQIQLLTNARVLKDHIKAKELAEIGGGNLFVSIPLYSDVDSIHDKICGSKGVFWDCIEGIYNLERYGVDIELRTVIIKDNYRRMTQFAEFIYRNIPFVGNVAFMAMEPIGIALKNIKRLWIDPVDYMSQLSGAIKILWRRDMGVSIFNHQLCTLPQELWPLAKKSISDWKIVYFDECENCKEKESCGGFFFSAEKYRSRAISPIR